MKAQQLYKQDGTETGVWFCSQCNSVYGYKNSFYGRTPEQMADDCCMPKKCERCGRELPERYSGHCEQCRRIVDDENLKAKYESATKLKPNEYDGWVWDPRNCYDGTYYSSVNELISDADDIPKWVFACSEQLPRQICISDIEEMMFIDSYEDAADNAGGIKELGAALDAFWEINKSIISYYPDYSRVIVLNEQKDGEPNA